MIDSTAIRSTRAASGAGRKTGADEPPIALYAAVEAASQPDPTCLVTLTGHRCVFPLWRSSQYVSYAQPQLGDLSIPSSQSGCPRKRCKWLLADKGYDTEALRRYCDQYRMQSVIPMRYMKRNPKPVSPDCLIGPNSDRATSSSACLAGGKRTAALGHALTSSRKAMPMVSLACSMRCLRHRFSYRT